MSNIKKFIKTKQFWLHGFLASISAVVFLWLFFQSMNLYTDHNNVVAVPEFKGQSISTLNNFIEDKSVQFKIIDSIYKPDEKPGIVIDQDPQVNSTVKKNRTIYLYVTSMVPPQIMMPKLIDRSLRQALSMIESYGLNIGTVKYINDPCVNCILKQIVDGKPVEPGTPVKKGTKIDLIVGKGNETNEKISLINVVGLTYCEAKSKLTAAGFKIGAVITDEKINDTCKAYILKQIPFPGSSTEVNLGSSVDVYLSKSKPKIETTNNENEVNFNDENEE